jgi:hypothetical protein
MPEYLLLRGQDSWVGARQRDAAAAVSVDSGDKRSQVSGSILSHWF